MEPLGSDHEHPARHAGHRWGATPDGRVHKVGRPHDYRTFSGRTWSRSKSRAKVSRVGLIRLRGQWGYAAHFTSSEQSNFFGFGSFEFARAPNSYLSPCCASAFCTKASAV